MNRQEVCVVTGQTRNICERFQKDMKRILGVLFTELFWVNVAFWCLLSIWWQCKEVKTIKNANDSNHWNANDSCPVECYFFFPFFPLWIKQVFVLAFFGIAFLNYNSYTIRFSHDKHICIYLWVNLGGLPSWQ